MKIAGVFLILLGIFNITTSFILFLILTVIGSILFFASNKKEPKVNVSVSFVPPADNSKAKKKRASKLPLVGNIETVCPYCDSSLEKRPGRKKKCPSCGEFIYVRTRPSDNQRVLVTEDQAEIIEEQWSIVNGTQKEFLRQKEEGKRVVAKERQELEKRFGSKPSDTDIEWSLLNKDILKHAQDRNWGFFRNTKFGMAEILRKEAKLKDALAFYLEVCYLDLNGPSNVGGISDPKLLKEYPAWNPKDDSFLAPGVVSRAIKIIDRVKYDRSSSNELFLSRAMKLKKSLRLPVSPQKAWGLLEKELFDE